VVRECAGADASGGCGGEGYTEEAGVIGGVQKRIVGIAGGDRAAGSAVASGGNGATAEAECETTARGDACAAGIFGGSQFDCENPCVGGIGGVDGRGCAVAGWSGGDFA